MTTIREATVADAPVIVDMATRFLQAHYRDVITPDAASIAAVSTRLLTSEEGIGFIAETDGEPVGMIGAMRFVHPMSGELMASEVVWWVNPEARGIGMRLLRAVEGWARQHGVKRLQLIAPTEATETLYARLGCLPVERIYQRVLA